MCEGCLMEWLDFYSDFLGQCGCWLGFMLCAVSFGSVSLPSAGSHDVRSIVPFFRALVMNSRVWKSRFN